MSNKRYLEISSTYRNRKQYPNPFDFTVLISQSGTRDAIHAYDPISLSAPQKIWSPMDLLLNGFVENSPTNTDSKFTVNFTSAMEAVKDIDYYIGLPIQIGAEFSRIIGWNLLSSSSNNDFFNITVNPPLPVAPTTGAVTFSTASDLSIGSIFIPDGSIATNYYNGYILYNETQNDSRPIISYDGISKLVGLDLSTQFGGLINVGIIWNLMDTFNIRKMPPSYVGTLPGGDVPSQFNKNTSFFVPLNTHVSVGDFIRFTGLNHKNTNCRVTNYTAVGSVTNTLPIVTTDCILNPIASVIDTFEVLPFTSDNAVPFCYTGSLVSQQEMVCYEIELINLVLPNILLKSGGLVTFYPYVYVELQNVSGASSGTKSIIYSNNQNSTRMLFRAVIDDIPNPVLSPFVKIDGDGMLQTVKFKPNDNLKFGVYLPTGEPLETVRPDSFSPASPDKLIQVSALFSIRRL
jgi:hypothetical protein